MTTRRDLILGASLLGIAGAAQALVPRRRTSLLGDAKLDALVPKAVAGWAEAKDVAVIAPPPRGSLADRLYSQQVQRLYNNREGQVIMLLIAYGDTQSDELQLHRPETCYPAVGFQVSQTRVEALPVAGGAPVPVRQLNAQLDQRNEQILYWTRLGEYLPTSNSEQRAVRLRNALHGEVSDGVLVRISTLNLDSIAGLATTRQFATDFVTNISPALRRALLGTAYARLGCG